MIRHTLRTINGIICSSSRSNRRERFLLIAMCHRFFLATQPITVAAGGRLLSVDRVAERIDSAGDGCSRADRRSGFPRLAYA
jgi:hypothetical protein